MAKTGIIIANLGTPTAPTVAAVRRFLAEFLADPCVVKLPRWLWYPILYGFILPFRPYKVAKLYQNVWMEAGSPLTVYTQALTAGLQAAFAEREDLLWHIGMTYGEPSIATAWQSLLEQGAERFLVVPLFPQFSDASTGAVMAKVHELPRQDSISRLKDYYDHPDYIAALAAAVRAAWAEHGQTKQLLISFHGIPRKNILQGEVYAEHCQETAHLLADALDLTSEQWCIAFQSRLGRAPWLQPYTDIVLEEWAKTGIDSVTVISPSFAVDCLETLEELAITNKEDYLEAGGKQFIFVPSLNASETQIALMQQLIQEAL